MTWCVLALVGVPLLQVVAATTPAAPAHDASAVSQPRMTGAQTTAAMTCVSAGHHPERTWTFTPRGDGWSVAHRSGSDGRLVSLDLPKAKASFSPHAVSLTSRTANGGIDVSLHGTPERAALDIYISYELEVNVDTTLTPEIDELNTHGRIGVRCTRGNVER